MARLNLTGFEISNGFPVEYSNNSGTFSMSTSTVRTGTYSLRTNPTTTAVGWIQISGIAADGTATSYSVATNYSRFYFNYATIPAANDESIFCSATSSGTAKFDLRINSSGNLVAYNTSGTLLTTGATVLSASTWYRIEVKCGTGASGAWEVKINGTSEMSGTANLAATNNAVTKFGKFANNNGNTVDFFYDDIAIDDTAYPGAGQILAGIPTANGSTMQWTSGTAPSNYTTVDEIPIAGADYIMSTSSAGDVGLMAMQDSSTIGVTGTISSVKAIVSTAENSSVISDTFIRVRSSSTNSDSSSSNGSTTYRLLCRILDTDPATSAAWTTSGLDGIEVGPVENNTVAVRCDAIYYQVEYQPATTTTSSSTSSSTSTSSTSSSTSTSSTSSSTSSTSSSTSLSTSTSSTSSSTSVSTSSTSKSTSTSSTSTSISTSSTSSSTSTSSTSSSTSLSTSTSSTSSSTSKSTSTSSTSSSTSISTSSTSTSISTSTSSTSSSTSKSTSTSSTSSSTSISTSTSSTSTSISTSTSSTSSSTSKSTSTSSTSNSTSTSISTSTSSTSSSTSTSTSSTSTSTTTVAPSLSDPSVIPIGFVSLDRPRFGNVRDQQVGFIRPNKNVFGVTLDNTLMDDTVALMDDPSALMGQQNVPWTDISLEVE